MRKTLQSFIEKTATSRDANEFLLRYSRVDRSEFLLVIVRVNGVDQLEELCRQIDDLLAGCCPHDTVHSQLPTQFTVLRVDETLLCHKMAGTPVAHHSCGTTIRKP